MGVLENIVKADRRDHDAAEAEILARGRYWAAREIVELRREIGKLRRQLEKTSA